MLENDHPVLHPQPFHFRLQPLQRLFQGFMGDDERSPVDGNHVLSAALLEHLQGLFGGAVVHLEPVGLVGGYGKEGQKELMALPFLSEGFRVSRVPGKKNGLPIFGEQVAVIPPAFVVPGAAPPPVGRPDRLDPPSSLFFKYGSCLGFNPW